MRAANWIVCHHCKCRFGGFCQGVDEFDANMFRLAPAEAAATDPAQRVLMEQTLQALNDAASLQGVEMGSVTGKALPLMFS